MRDRSLWTLTGANLINVLLAIIFQWNVYEVMLVYWFQSVSIGIFTCHKLLTYPIEKYQDEIDAGNALEINDQAITIPKTARIIIAAFFAIHYGLFHLVYIIFIVGFASSEGVALDLAWGSVGALFFLGSHFYSYLIHGNNDPAKTEQESTIQILNKSNIADTFSKPYIRIIPIHLTIMAGGAASFFLTGGLFASRLVLILFMVLKTIVDLKAHIKKHQQDEVS